ncbi:c-type cytochrome [Arenimonas daejeonensis]|uniref:c-type cytochrome n=1 Tax=Arenimonas daejeonensis TaxID=370777 RepID=UPI0011BD5172|nr:c-type cytochrome [Arenimonas daejeonensis]
MTRCRTTSFRAALFVAVSVLTGCGQPPTPPATASAPAVPQVDVPPGTSLRPLTDRVFEATAARRDRGRYLGEGLLQCLVCHSERDWEQPGAPPKLGREGAGLVWRDDGKGRRLVAPNITPDAETGTGRWTDDMLARAIREGIGHDGRVLHPAMWYRSFSNLSDEDLASVVVWLRTLTPVRNPLPRTQMSEEELKRAATAPRAILEPVHAPDVSMPVQRGRYLASLADCSGCHTGWEAPRLAGLYAGGNLIERGEHHAHSTNLNPHASGVDYDAEAFIRIIRTGKGGTTHPMMPWVAFRNLDDTDLHALHAWLASRPPIAHWISNQAPPTLCTVCGQEHGLGERNRIELPEAVAVDPARFDGLVGHYRNERYDWSLEIRRDGDNLLAVDPDGPSLRLIPLSETRYWPDGGLAPLRFELDDTGRALRVISEEEADLVLERLPEA